VGVYNIAMRYVTDTNRVRSGREREGQEKEDVYKCKSYIYYRHPQDVTNMKGIPYQNGLTTVHWNSNVISYNTFLSREK